MWCPKCKTEYQDGFTVCADCGTKLLEGTEDDFDVVDICDFKDEAVADQFVEYLSYSGIDKAKKKSDDNGIFIITVPAKEEKQAEKLFRGFMLAAEEEKEAKKEVETVIVDNDDANDITEAIDDTIVENEISDENDTDDESADYNWDAEDENGNVTENEIDPFDAEDEVHKEADNIVTEDIDEDPEDILYTPAKSYTKKLDEYKDMKFSGFTFIIFGIIGIAYLVLCKLDIIPIEYNIVVFVIITIMFVAFILMGITSVIKSGKIKLQIPEEEAMTETVMKWLDENLTQDTIDNWTDKSISTVENDLLITAHIRASLIKKYPELDVAYLEMITDDFFNANFVKDDEYDDNIYSEETVSDTVANSDNADEVVDNTENND